MKVSPNDEASSTTATIEFDSKEDALAAQTKDQKHFEDNIIQVQLGTGATIYVKNYPPSADESYMKQLFGKVSIYTSVHEAMLTSEVWRNY